MFNIFPAGRVLEPVSQEPIKEEITSTPPELTDASHAMSEEKTHQSQDTTKVKDGKTFVMCFTSFSHDV